MFRINSDLKWDLSNNIFYFFEIIFLIIYNIYYKLILFLLYNV